MKRTIRSEEQVIGILQEHEAGAKCADLCRMASATEETRTAMGMLCLDNIAAVLSGKSAVTPL